MLVILAFSPMAFAEPSADSGATPQASPPEAKSPEAKTALAHVESNLVEPLTAKESARGKFSRARMPAQARRVRILDEQPSKDAKGIAFVRFAVDARYGYIANDDERQWRRDDITGCVYLDKSQIFVKSGDQYRPAAFLLGKNLKAAAQTTCQAAPAQVAHSD